MTLVKSNNSLFPSLWNNFFDHDWFIDEEVRANGHTLPAANIKELENKYVIELAAPGKNKADFDVQLDQKVLTISSSSKKEKHEEKFNRREFRYESFKRSFTLPNSVAEENISAKYENGILMIDVPKREEAVPKPNRTIAIN